MAERLTRGAWGGENDPLIAAKLQRQMAIMHQQHEAIAQAHADAASSTQKQMTEAQMQEAYARAVVKKRIHEKMSAARGETPSHISVPSPLDEQQAISDQLRRSAEAAEKLPLAKHPMDPGLEREETAEEIQSRMSARIRAAAARAAEESVNLERPAKEMVSKNIDLKRRTPKFLAIQTILSMGGLVHSVEAGELTDEDIINSALQAARDMVKALTIYLER